MPGAGDTNNASFNVASDRLQTAAAAAAGDFQFRAESRNVGDTNLFLEAAFTVTAEVDSDLDGLADDWELLYAPNLDVLDGDGVADSDSDGLTDLEEYVLLFTDAWAVDPTDPDSDEDDLLDGDEVNGTGARPVTNPTSDDTDGDTLKDGVESNTRVFVDAFDTGTDPTDKDTDDDTLFDNIELNTGVFVSTNNPGTSPLTPDSDLDGLTDAEELVLAVAFGGPTDPNDWDSDDDTAGDGLEYNVFFSDPNNPASVPLFNWPTPKGTFAGIPASYSIGAATPNVAVDELLGGFFVELKVGEQLRASFDITAQQVGNADNLDLRVGFGSTSACTFPGYMNPTTDLGPPAGTTATLRFRNDSFDWGSNQQNTTLENSSQVPANGGVTGVGNANSVSFTLVRTDLGYYSVFQWEEIVLESPITPVQYYSNPLWERVFVRLQRSNANDLFALADQIQFHSAMFLVVDGAMSKELKIEVGTEQSSANSVLRMRLTVEEQILQDIKDIGRETVAALVAQLPGQASEQGRADLQRQIEAAKTNNRIERLTKIIEFAVANGDEAKAAEARRILDITLNGPQPLAQKPNRPAPAQNQGGQR